MKTGGIVDPKLKLAVPAVTLLLALTACGGGSKAAESPSAGGANAAANGAAGSAEVTEDLDEPQLSGEILQKATEAALAKYPGTVLKAEEEAPGKPGKYGVWVKKKNGAKIEVFLTEDFGVTGTRTAAE
jgi:hypothetical protein